MTLSTKLILLLSIDVDLFIPYVFFYRLQNSFTCSFVARFSKEIVPDRRAKIRVPLAAVSCVTTLNFQFPGNHPCLLNQYLRQCVMVLKIGQSNSVIVQPATPTLLRSTSSLSISLNHDHYKKTAFDRALYPTSDQSTISSRLN